MSTNDRFYLSYDPKTTLIFFLRENAKIAIYYAGLLWPSIHTITKICKPQVAY